jgi:diaminopimelate epimerase
LELNFFKYQGAGNDFIVADNRNGQYSSLKQETIEQLCNRQFGVGADGLILIQNMDDFDFRMVYFNADGNEGSFCGNGARCAVAFALQTGILRSMDAKFVASDGGHFATITQSGIKVTMRVDGKIKSTPKGILCNTGSPHIVVFTEDIEHLDVFGKGKKLRNSKEFVKEGINVNFVEEKPGILLIRTYERGVENETLSCGTGVTAAALVYAEEKALSCGPVILHSKGGELKVDFEKTKKGFENISLEGPAEFVYQGKIKC